MQGEQKDVALIALPDLVRRPQSEPSARPDQP